MSAPKMCGKCRFKWMQDEDNNPCGYCCVYDYENEIYTDFYHFEPATNADRLQNIANLSLDELALLLVEINDPTRSRGGWLNWLKKEME